MPTWGELLQELKNLRAEVQQQAEANPGFQSPAPVDLLRRKYMDALAKRTGRSVIIYATAWMEGRPGQGDAVSIQLGDQHGFMEACSNLTDSRELDLILHSPGGSAEAADAMMAYLRSQFDSIRAIVPVAAMSAATMMALACDSIVMGDHSQLGPIDPQFTIFTPEGPRSAPGQAIEDQFERAKRECGESKDNIAAWLPILRSYAPGLLTLCDHQQQLAKDFAAKALAEHMLSDEAGAEKKANDIADWFADFKEFRSHGRRVGRKEAEEQGLTVESLEADSDLQDAILSVHHATQHTFSNTATAKIVENHKGRAWLQTVQPVLVGQPAGGP